MRILCVWLPNWPIQRLVKERAEYRRQAVVLSQNGRRGASVAACSPRAHKRGARLGMPVAEAVSLLRQGEMHVEAYDPQIDLQNLLELAEWCEQFSPLAGIEEVDGGMHVARPHPESLLLNVTNLQDLSGGEQDLLQQVREAFRQRGYLVRLAIADTVGVAWAVSHFGEQEQTIVPAGRSLEAISAYPVEALRLARSTVDLLKQLGVVQIGQLFRLPRSSLSARLGPQVMLRLDQAQGRVDELWDARQPQRAWLAEQVLEHPLTSQEAVERIVEDLLCQLTAFLREEQLGVVRLVCRFRGRSERHYFEVGLFRPTADEKHLLELIQVRLERERLPEELQRISISLPVVARLQHRQTEMFEHLHRTAYSMELTHFVDRVANRLGADTVVRARLLAEAQPERGYRYDRLTFRHARRTAKATSVRNSSQASEEKQSGSMHRPLHLFDPPVPLKHVVTKATDPVRDCTVESFHWEGRRVDVVRLVGPERIETGWWRGEMVRRDYYRVEMEGGRWLWIYRCLRRNDWFLQGMFS